MRWIAHLSTSFVILCIVSVFVAACHPKREDGAQSRETNATRILVVDRIIESANVPGGFRHPGGIAASNDGGFFIADTDNDRILRFNGLGEMTNQHGGFGAGDAKLNRPVWLSVDNNLTLIVSDVGNKRVCRYTSDLQFIDHIPFKSMQDPALLGYPSGVAAVRNGELWVADKDNGSVAVFAVNGQLDRVIESTVGSAMLRSPSKLLYDNQEVIVCDAGNYRMAIFDEYGGFVSEFGDEVLRNPTGACVAGTDILAADHELGQVILFSRHGNHIDSFGPSLPGGGKPLLSPTDVAQLSDGRIVISDSGNNRILICKLIEG